MTTLIRSAKYGSDWTLNDLETYHISLNRVHAIEFFGLQALPVPSVDQELLSQADACHMEQDRHAELITLLDLAMLPEKGESAVVDFSVELLKLLGYVRRERVARTRVALPLFICGEMRHVETDICLVHRNEKDTLLLVQKEERLEPGQRHSLKAQAQLVAGAIAAFNENNAQREAAELPPLAEKVMPGIIMVGTSPVFLKVPVTQALSDRIRRGEYPPAETNVIYCYPPVSRPSGRQSEGMKPLHNRREILRCYEAFRTVVGI